MIPADTNIWIDHLYGGDSGLGRLLEVEEVAMHPFIVGEVALGSVRDRQATLRLLASLPRLQPADDVEALHLVERHRLFSRGIG